MVRVSKVRILCSSYVDFSFRSTFCSADWDWHTADVTAFCPLYFVSTWIIFVTISDFMLLCVLIYVIQGKGLFATQDFVEGEVIFVERPLVSAQFAWNAAYRYLACDYCMQSLETTEQMARRLTGNTFLTLPHSECCSAQPSEHVSCHYCSVSSGSVSFFVKSKSYTCLYNNKNDNARLRMLKAGYFFAFSINESGFPSSRGNI